MDPSSLRAVSAPALTGAFAPSRGWTGSPSHVVLQARYCLAVFLAVGEPPWCGVPLPTDGKNPHSCRRRRLLRFCSPPPALRRWAPERLGNGCFAFRRRPGIGVPAVGAVAGTYVAEYGPSHAARWAPGGVPANRILVGFFSGRGTNLHRPAPALLARYVPLWRRARAARILYALADWANRSAGIRQRSLAPRGISAASDLAGIPAPYVIDAGLVTVSIIGLWAAAVYEPVRHCHTGEESRAQRRSRLHALHPLARGSVVARVSAASRTDAGGTFGGADACRVLRWHGSLHLGFVWVGIFMWFDGLLALSSVVFFLLGCRWNFAGLSYSSIMCWAWERLTDAFGCSRGTAGQEEASRTWRLGE